MRTFFIAAASAAAVILTSRGRGREPRVHNSAEVQMAESNTR